MCPLVKDDVSVLSMPDRHAAILQAMAASLVRPISQLRGHREILTADRCLIVRLLLQVIKRIFEAENHFRIRLTESVALWCVML